MAKLVNNLPAIRVDLGLIPELGKSPGEGKGYPLQYSALKSSMDCIAHGFANSQTRLRDFHIVPHCWEVICIHMTSPGVLILILE